MAKQRKPNLSLIELCRGGGVAVDQGWLARKEHDEIEDMLREVKAGERTELLVPIIATTERDNPRPLPATMAQRAERNFVRFHLPEFPEFAESFADRVFLRDHSSRAIDRGGIILTSTAKRRGKVHRIEQELRLVKQWSMESALDGTMRTFSIGWEPRLRGVEGLIESAICTVCDGPMFGPESVCDHFPGQRVKFGSPPRLVIVELEWHHVVGRETSDITFPAADGTAIAGDMRAVITRAVEEMPELRRLRRQRSAPVDPKFLASLGLPKDATEADVDARIAELNRSSREPTDQLAMERARREAAEESSQRHQRAAEASAAEIAQRDTDRLTSLRAGALADGLFTNGDKRAVVFDKTAARSYAEAVEVLDTWRSDPAVPVVGTAQAPRAIDPPDGGNIRAVSVPGGDEYEKFVRSGEAWLIEKAGMRATVEQAYAKDKDKRLKYDYDDSPFRGYRLIEIARSCVEKGGISTRGMSQLELVAASFTLRSSFATRSAGYAATGDFPVLLENLMHKTLLGEYETTPDSWSRFAMTGSVSDFRAHNRYRMGSFNSLSVVNEAGEFTNLAVPDARRESISATTKGNIVAITRQAIIDDDLSAFTRIASMLGRAARRTIEIDVYAELALNGGLGPLMADGIALFNAAHGNISAGLALSGAALDADRVLMAQQTDESGNDFLDLRPQVILVPLSLGSLARSINTSEFDIDPVNPGTDDRNLFRAPNSVRGLFRDIVDTPRLSGTRRYLFANPNIAPTFEVAFLDGQQEPFLELMDTWRTDGSEYKVRMDYGVAGIDFRGAITNAGV